MKKIIILIAALAILGICIFYFVNKTPRLNFNNTVLVGMCPDEVIKKVGAPYFLDAQLDQTKWKSGTDPQMVIMKECTEPDESKFSLYFDWNGKHEVVFEKGKVVRITDVVK